MKPEKELTSRSESLKTTLQRWGYNFFPAYFSCGAKLRFLSSDYREIHVEIPFNWRTKDKKGELFKGIQYAAMDPLYPLMLRKNLDDKYKITENESTIRFREPAKTRLNAKLELTVDEIKRIKDELEHHDSVIRVYKADLVDKDDKICSEVEKTLSIGH